MTITVCARTYTNTFILAYIQICRYASEVESFIYIFVQKSTYLYSQIRMCTDSINILYWLCKYLYVYILCIHPRYGPSYT